MLFLAIFEKKKSHVSYLATCSKKREDFLSSLFLFFDRCISGDYWCHLWYCHIFLQKYCDVFSCGNLLHYLRIPFLINPKIDDKNIADKLLNVP